MKNVTRMAGIGFVSTSLLILATEALSKPRPPLPPIPERCLLSLRFNETNWWGSLQPGPLVFDNIQLVESWSGYALYMPGKPSSRLQYPIVALDAKTERVRTNLTLGVGSLRFWFRSDWSSAALGGSGPGVFGRLVEVGAWTEDARAGWWSLFFSDDGDAIHFSAQAQGQQGNYLAVPIHWQAGTWHLVVLNYGPKASELYLDGALAAQGEGVTLWTDATGHTTQGFSIGSDLNGKNAAGGQFEEWTSFGYTLRVEEVAHYYSSTRPLTKLGAITPEEEKAQLAYLAAFREAVNQRGGAESMLTDSLNGPAFDYGTNLHLRPPVSQGSNVWLTIAGGPAGATNDFLRTTNLVGSDITESQWVHLGKGVTGQTYLFTNQPMPQALYVLGTPQDSDHDGTNDALEILIFHSDPYEGLPPFEVFITQPNNGSLLP